MVRRPNLGISLSKNNLAYFLEIILSISYMKGKIRSYKFLTSLKAFLIIIPLTKAWIFTIFGVLIFMNFMLRYQFWIIFAFFWKIGLLKSILTLILYEYCNLLTTLAASFALLKAIFNLIFPVLSSSSFFCGILVKVNIPLGFPSLVGNKDSLFSILSVLLSSPIIYPFFSISFCIFLSKMEAYVVSPSFISILPFG